METKQYIGRLTPDAAAGLARGILAGQGWASPEETAAWLKTETGKRIAAMIDIERKKRR